MTTVYQPPAEPPDTQALFRGDWRTAPRHCSGTVEIWDQTVGCAECQMNIWYLPTSDHEALLHIDNPSGAHLFPPWAPEHVIAELRDHEARSQFHYEPFMELFNMAHPFQFDDCHDPGDEDDGNWPAAELYLKAIIEANPLNTD